MHLSGASSPKVSLSPFRLRLRIALTRAVAIEGERGWGDPLLSNLSGDFFQILNYLPTETGDEQMSLSPSDGNLVGCSP